MRQEEKFMDSYGKLEDDMESVVCLYYLCVREGDGVCVVAGKKGMDVREGERRRRQLFT